MSSNSFPTVLSYPTPDAIRAALDAARGALARAMSPAPAPVKKTRFQAFFFYRRPCSAMRCKEKTGTAHEENWGGRLPAESLCDQWAYREWFHRDEVPPGWFDRANALRLARDLKRSGTEYRPGLLRRAARRLGGWLNEGLAMLDKTVREAFDALVPAPDGLTLAMEEADRDAHLFLPLVGGNERVAKLAALACHLSRNRAGLPAAFPAVRIGKWLGVSHNRVRDGLKKLEELRLVKVDRNWSFKAGLAQQVIWAGPQLGDEVVDGTQGTTSGSGETIPPRCDLEGRDPQQARDGSGSTETESPEGSSDGVRLPRVQTGPRYIPPGDPRQMPRLWFTNGSATLRTE